MKTPRFQRGRAGSKGRAETGGRLESMSQAGFSLIELMVGVIITTIMLGVSIPAMVRYMTDHKTLGYAENLASDLRLCRQRALSQSNQFLFSWDSANKRYTLIDDANNNGVADNGETTIGPKTAPDGVTLTNGPSNAFTSLSPIIFLATGAANQGGQLRISDTHGITRDITVVRATGMVKIL